MPTTYVPGESTVRVKLGVFWQGLRDSLWLLPTLLTVAAVVLAALTVELDRRLLADGRVDFYLAFSGGAEGARGVLTAIGSTVITVTGVIFSVTIVALQLASSQFTPRVLRGFVGDRSNQVVLGVFIGTFTYTLLVLRTVRSAAEDGRGFVPSLSVATAIGLALLSIGLLIYFIHHVARSIQAAVIVDRAARDTHHVVDRLARAAEAAVESQDVQAPAPDGRPVVVTADRAGYVQGIDEDALFDLARRSQATVCTEPRLGEHLLPGAPLVSVWAPGPLPEDAEPAIRQAFVLGPDRTLRDDLELGMRQLTDIALRALSPSLNDPTTAMICFDRLAELLVRVGRRPTPPSVRRTGGACLVTRRQTFADLVNSIFGLTRRSVAADPHVAAHVVQKLGQIGELVRPEHRPALAAQVLALQVTVEATATTAYDLDPVRDVARAALQSMREASPRNQDDATDGTALTLAGEQRP